MSDPKQYFIVWNEARSEGFITDDAADAEACRTGVSRSWSSAMGDAFAEAYDEEERPMQTLVLGGPFEEPQS